MSTHPEETLNLLPALLGYAAKRILYLSGGAYSISQVDEDILFLFKKFPDRAQNIIRGSNEYLKYLPVDSGTASMMTPILDFTAKQNIFGGSGETDGHPVLDMHGGSVGTSGGTAAETRILNSGKKSTKRSVSETKKKFVASRQNWKCGDCNEQLSAWFEVDHKIRLEHGGSNHVDNLVALCRECHGCKTAMENL